MSPLRIYHDDRDDMTLLSNMFIDDYMKDANDVQIKVFLYLVRMVGAHRAVSISDLADKFNYPEKDVERALKFWEKNMLLRVEYDEHKNIIAIRFLSPPKKKRAESPTQPEPMAAAYTKPSYTLDELQAFKENEEYAQLLFVVEQYLGKTLSPTDIKSVFFLTDTLHFSGDLIDYLIQYCVERGKKDFRYIEKVAIGWAEEGITTPKQAARAARRYDKIVYDVMKALGKNSSPTKSEADYILRWVREFGFSAELIFEACERTVLSVDSHRFEYCNKILANWKAGGVRHKADIIRLDSAFARKRAGSAGAQSGATLQFNQFKQNNYDFEALEREIVSN